MKRFWIEIAILIAMVACGGGAQLVFAQHSVTLTWTAPSSMPSGSYINVYRGTSAGAESAAAVNPTGLPATQVTYTDSNVLANAKYYYVVKQCDISLATNSEVCSSPSNETNVIVPMVGSDLSAPGVLSAVAK